MAPEIEIKEKVPMLNKKKRYLGVAGEVGDAPVLGVVAAVAEVVGGGLLGQHVQFVQPVPEGGIQVHYKCIGFHS